MVDLRRAISHLQRDVIHQVVVGWKEVHPHFARKACLSSVLKREPRRSSSADRKANGEANENPDEEFHALFAVVRPDASRRIVGRQPGHAR